MRESGLPTASNREAQRQEIERQVDEFLKNGGHIDCIEKPNPSNIRPIGTVSTPLIENYFG